MRNLRLADPVMPEDRKEEPLPLRMDIAGAAKVEPRQNLSPGAWYVGLTCTGCQSDFAVLDDPANNGQIQVTGGAALDASCPKCGYAARYGAADMHPFQAVSGGPASPL